MIDIDDHDDPRARPWTLGFIGTMIIGLAAWAVFG